MNATFVEFVKTVEIESNQKNCSNYGFMDSFIYHKNKDVDIVVEHHCQKLALL